MMKPDIYLVATAGLLALALAVGGAGENFPLLAMLLGLVALAVAGTLAWSGHPLRLTRLARCALALVAAVLLVPLLQLVPLPPSVWHALPGRELPAQIDASLGLSGWRPLTLDVEGTVRAFLNLIPASVLFVGCLRLHSADRSKLLLMIAGFALFNAVLGIAQLATGGSMTPYPSSHLGYPIGLFVNRNHNAVFLLLSMPLIAALAARKMQGTESRLPYIVGTLAVLTIVGVVVIATTSRMALALLPVALVGSLALLFFRQSFLRLAVPSTLALAAVAATISWVGGFNRNLARFGSLHDGRFDYWDDVSWALHHYGLAGTGFGSFVPVYQTAESLSGISPAILNHAHNDFIEIVLEGGIPAIVLLLLFFAILVAAAVQLMKKRFEFGRASLSLAAALGVMLVLIFSLVDYPLRMPAISCTFAVLCACFLPTPVAVAAGREIAVPRSRAKRSWPFYAPRLAGLAALAAAALFVVESGVSASNILSDDYASASDWAPWSTAAHEALAADALAASHRQQADQEALATLRLSPIDAVAVRTAAVVRMLGGSATQANELMQLAATLGWRDSFTQVWAIQASQRTGEPEKAIQRAEALFQQEQFLAPSLALLLQDAPNGPTARALIQELATRPAWRANFVKSASELPLDYVAKLTAVAAGINRSAAPLSVEESQPLLDRLLAADDTENARLLWAGVRRGRYVANGNFDAVSSRNGADVPSDWDVSDEDLATITTQAPDFPGHGRALRISSAARSGGILSQRLMLSPGAYSLTYRARSGPGAAVVLRWRFRCTSSDDTQTSNNSAAASAQWQEFSAKFIVPIQDCPIQRLALERPGDMHSPEVWVDDVSIKQAIQ
jgi:O-antigen ligase